MIRAVVFDMDGVLIDARDWHFEALNRALGLLGFQISRFDHLSTYDGLPTRRKLEMLSIERGLPRELHGFLNELKQSYTLELVEARCKPIFQHEYALAQLKARDFKLAVASNSVRRTVEVMLERANLLPYLDAILSNEDVEHAKPHPQMYERAVELLQVNPDETLVVEDNEVGVQSARAAGTHVMTVENPVDVTFDAITRTIASVEGVTA
jgi:beta-phosphoglucomutase